jgi:hypothetical protein
VTGESAVIGPRRSGPGPVEVEQHDAMEVRPLPGPRLGDLAVPPRSVRGRRRLAVRVDVEDDALGRPAFEQDVVEAAGGAATAPGRAYGQLHQAKGPLPVLATHVVLRAL